MTRGTLDGRGRCTTVRNRRAAFRLVSPLDTLTATNRSTAGKGTVILLPVGAAPPVESPPFWEPRVKNLAMSRTWQLIWAFAAVYLIWGSTYLAIRFCVQAIPPLVVAGSRFLTAGVCLLGIAIAAGAPWPTRPQIVQAGLIGSFLLVGGNGLVCWAEQTVPSGVTALLIATMPLWMVSFDVLLFRAAWPPARIVAGLLVGLVGVVALMGRDRLLGQSIDWWGACGILGACSCWAYGSLRARGADLPKSPFVASAFEMLIAGTILLAVAVPFGDWSRLRWHEITPLAIWSLAYLIVFGSMVALSAYAWLLKNCEAAMVSTYAYVNPIVAVLLGAALGGEELSPRIGVGAALVLTAVLLVTLRPRIG